MGQPPFQEGGRELCLPGAWHFSSLPKRGIWFQASFKGVQPKPALTISPRPVWSPATVLSARGARLLIDPSGKSSWDLQPRSTLRKHGSQMPLVVRPLGRPITAWEPPITSKRHNARFGSDYLPVTLGVLPEYPTFSVEPGAVIEPEYCLPLSGNRLTNGLPNWVRRSGVTLPAECLGEARSARIRGLQSRDRHVPPTPELAAWSRKFGTGTHVSGPVVLTALGLTTMDSCRPTSSRGSRAGLHFTEALLALKPSPAGPPSPVAPSLIRPKLQSIDPNTSSILEVSPAPYVFATARQVGAPAIPELQTGAGQSRSRAWFAARVPSPHVLETPTPLDTSKRPHSVYAARHIRFGAVPAEVVPRPAGLGLGGTQILHTTPDTLSDSAVFRTLARLLTLKNVLEVSELRPPTASSILRAPVPVEQRAEMAESFISYNAERFPLRPATRWTALLNEAALRETGPATRRVRPVPDSIAESCVPLRVERFPVGPATLCTAPLNEANLRGSGPATCGIRPVPDSPEFFYFRPRALAAPSWGFEIASLIGASFAACAALPCEPGTGRVVMPQSAHQRWNKPADRPSAKAGMLQLVQLAPALAPFSKVAHPDSMRSSFATDLRDRIFNPVLPQFPRTRLLPARVEPSRSKLHESRDFAPVGFRWQRNRKLRDRGAPWKAPTGIGLLPVCELPNWPGPVSALELGDRQAPPN